MSVTLCPDSIRYLNPDPPSPFHLRPLVPALCGTTAWRWKAATYIGLALTIVGTWAIVGGWQGVAAALLLAALPSVRFNATHPVLVDAAALGFATTSAALWVHGWWLPAIAVTCLAAATKETAPIFAACFAWTPWLLAALAIPLLVALIRRPGPDPLNDEHHAWILAHPIQASRKYHHRYLIDANPVLLTPWGGATVALAAPSAQLAATLAAGYTQLAFATDTVRLYQWAAPVVCIAATTAVPPIWWPLLIIVTLFNPLRGDGV